MSLGLLIRKSSGWRCAMGGAVPWGLLVGVSGAASVFLGFVPASVGLLGVVWVAPCH